MRLKPILIAHVFSSDTRLGQRVVESILLEGVAPSKPPRCSKAPTRRLVKYPGSPGIGIGFVHGASLLIPNPANVLDKGFLGGTCRPSKPPRFFPAINRIWYKKWCPRQFLKSPFVDDQGLATGRNSLVVVLDNLPATITSSISQPLSEMF